MLVRKQDGTSFMVGDGCKGFARKFQVVRHLLLTLPQRAASALRFSTCQIMGVKNTAHAINFINMKRNEV
jgi:hypothetical protein